MNFEFITCDLGVNHISPYFNKETTLESIPMDTLWLNVFKCGCDPSLIGPPFSGVEALLTTFELAYQSKPLECT